MSETRATEQPPRLQFGTRAMFVAVTIIALLVAAAAALHRFEISERGPTRPFDAMLWKQADPNKHRTVRSEMVDDLLERYDFTGWSRAEIADLLGPSMAPPIGSGFEQWDMIYLLGLERGSYALDDEALGFKFDKAGRVVMFGTSVN